MYIFSTSTNRTFPTSTNRTFSTSTNRTFSIFNVNKSDFFNVNKSDFFNFNQKSVVFVFSKARKLTIRRRKCTIRRRKCAIVRRNASLCSQKCCSVFSNDDLEPTVGKKKLLCCGFWLVVRDPQKVSWTDSTSRQKSDFCFPKSDFSTSRNRTF